MFTFVILLCFQTSIRTENSSNTESTEYCSFVFPPPLGTLTLTLARQLNSFLIPSTFPPPPPFLKIKVMPGTFLSVWEVSSPVITVGLVDIHLGTLGGSTGPTGRSREVGAAGWPICRRL